MFFLFPIVGLWVLAASIERNQPALVLLSLLVNLPYLLYFSLHSGMIVLVLLSLLIFIALQYHRVRFAWICWVGCVIVAVIPLYAVLFSLTPVPRPGGQLYGNP